MEIVTITLIAINIIIFALPMLVPSLKTALVRNLIKDNNEILGGDYYRLLTSAFVHNDLSHIGMNMYSLYVLAPSTASFLSILGKPDYLVPLFLVLYIFCAITSSLLSYWKNPSPSAGASGAIYGMLGYIFVMAILYGQFQVVQSLLFIIILNLGFAFMPGSRLDNWGHGGGFIGGVVFAIIFFLINTIFL